MWRTRRAVGADGADGRNSGADANASTRYPADPINRRRARRTDRSSSTMEIIGPDMGMAWEHSTRSYRAGPGLVVDLGPPPSPAPLTTPPPPHPPRRLACPARRAAPPPPSP